MTVLKVAMIGAGRMGQTHAHVLNTLHDVHITHVVDYNPDNAKRVADTLNATVSTLDDVLNNKHINAVFITTPTPTHADVITQAAHAGKAIFVEKPLADTLEAATRVVSVIKETGVACQVGFQRRYDPAYALAKKRITQGELGAIENFRAISRDPFQPSTAFLRSCGGMLVDLGIHDFDSARFFCGEVKEVYATGTTVRDEELKAMKFHNLVVATLRFENGAVGTLENALNTSYGYEIVADILGEKGRFHLEKTRQLNLEFWNESGVSHDYPRHFDERFPEAYAAEVIAFAKNVLAGNPVTPTAEDALESSRLALAAQHALESGCVVDVQAFGR